MTLKTGERISPISVIVGQDAAVVRDRAVALLQGLLHNRTVHVGERIAGIDAHCLAVVGGGTVVHALGSPGIAAIDQTIALDPDEAIPRNNRGDAYYQMGQVDRAMDDFNAAIKLDPTYVDALNNRGLAYMGRGAYDLAIADFDRVLKLRTKDADATRNRAAALAKKSKQ